MFLEKGEGVRGRGKFWNGVGGFLSGFNTGGSEHPQHKLSLQDVGSIGRMLAVFFSPTSRVLAFQR